MFFWLNNNIISYLDRMTLCAWSAPLTSTWSSSHHSRCQV